MLDQCYFIFVNDETSISVVHCHKLTLKSVNSSLLLTLKRKLINIIVLIYLIVPNTHHFLKHITPVTFTMHINNLS